MRITWFGHSAFLLEAGGKRVLVDPFLSGNPTFASVAEARAAEARKTVEQGLTHIVLTHGHGDHVGDTIALGLAKKPTIFCSYDLGVWLMGKAAAANGGADAGLPFELMNTGGTVENGGVSVTLVRADHSSGEIEDGTVSALGSANGAIIRLPGAPVVWHMGDTDIFTDMRLISELYRPEIVIIPIGDRFTMGPKSAAHAVRHFMPGVRVVIPCHWGTFGLLTGTPEMLREELGDLSRLVAEFAPHEPKEM